MVLVCVQFRHGFQARLATSSRTGVANSMAQLRLNNTVAYRKAYDQAAIDGEDERIGGRKRIDRVWPEADDGWRALPRN